MNWLQTFRDLAAEQPGTSGLTESGAYQLFSAMLDGGLDPLELGAALALLEKRGCDVPELIGFTSAAAERCFRVETTAIGGRVVLLPTYCGARTEPNLLPLLACGLQRIGVPVLVHGVLDSSCGVASAYILRELGVMPCANLAQAQDEIEHGKLAFVPSGLLAPGLSELMALRARLGFGRIANVLARLIEPVTGEALRMVAAESETERALFREFLQLQGGCALLFNGTDGGAFANPRQRPALEYLHEGISEVLFEAEARPTQHLLTVPTSLDAAATAAWTRRALAGEVPFPLPLVNQMASCLYGAGYTQDLNQAKAIVAVETGSLIAA